jgi:hypothetical protein
MRASRFASSAVALLLAFVGACANDVSAPGANDTGGSSTVGEACPEDPRSQFSCAEEGLSCTYYRDDGCPEVYTCTGSYDGTLSWDYFELQPAQGAACDTPGLSCTYYPFECQLGNDPPSVATCDGGQWSVALDPTTCDEIAIEEGASCLGCGMPSSCPLTVQTEQGEVEMQAVCNGHDGWELELSN